MKKLITIVSIGTFLSISGITAFAVAPNAVTISIINNSNYNFYLSGTEIPAGSTFSAGFNNHDTRQLTFDSATHPSPWKTSGYGNGGIAYSVDPSSGQSNVGLSMGPAAAATSSDLPPTFTISGQVNQTVTDNFSRGINYTLHSASSDPSINIEITGGV